ncbi:MAG: type II toxin-antitoxin system prevent-host-death family antitoxin [Deltaproteobacteria bacterium]|nr:type II toxin-antitoxin system prevent-host-death family antitoxin [Deltaproteobacteria bacterium]
MPREYSAYEAKAKFSEIIRKVQQGQRFFISYRGRRVAEIGPVEQGTSTEQHLDKLEQQGVIEPPRGRSDLAPLTRRPGALARFLAERE